MLIGDDRMKKDDDAEPQDPRDQVLIGMMAESVTGVEWQDYQITVTYRGRRILTGFQIKEIRVKQKGGEDGEKGE